MSYGTGIALEGVGAEPLRLSPAQCAVHVSSTVARIATIPAFLLAAGSCAGAQSAASTAAVREVIGFTAYWDSLSARSLATNSGSLNVAVTTGEIGTHTENHAALGGEFDEQRDRLARTQQQLAELTGSPVAGLRPPEEQFDARTLAAWRRVGGEYVFRANDGRSASPELVEVNGAPFVLIGRVMYIAIQNHGTREVPPFVLLVTLPSGERVAARSAPEAAMSSQGMMRVRIPALAVGTTYATTIATEGTHRTP